MNSNISQGAKKKRNRIPLSCTICRKRKVKCDKTRPHCNQCTKTGVAHLCHYMEQNWAQDAKREITKDNELKNLKERCKILEEKLARYMHNPSSGPLSATAANSPVGLINSIQETPIKLTNSPIVKTEDNMVIINEIESENVNKAHDYDELDLTRQFDLLHIKTNGTIHLGATHWLAIMKGDPYLKLLWTHIFTMREKLLEYYTNGSSGKRKKKAKKVSKCPVDHSKFKSIDVKQQFNQAPMPPPTSKPSTLHLESSAGNSNGLRGCPVDHSALTQATAAKDSPVPNSMTSITDRAQNKCPVNHSNITETKQQGMCPVNHSEMSTMKPGGVCPVNHTGMQAMSKPDNSGQNNVPKCPVDHSKSSTPKYDHNYNKAKKLSKEEVITRLCKMLPPKRIIMLYIDKFFKHFYPVIPILDELNFKNHINQIFDLHLLISNSIISSDPEAELEPLSSMNLKKPSDYCNLGILVIIMRLVWLSLPMNVCKIDIQNPLLAQLNSRIISEKQDEDPNSLASNLRLKDELQLYKYEVDAAALDLVKNQLIRFDEISSISNTNVNIATIQFAIFFKFYLMNCANAGVAAGKSGNFDNESHQILLSSIMMMAFSCGLHRDPDNFPQLNVVSSNLTTDNAKNTAGHAKTHTASSTQTNKDTQASTERAKHTWRKVWYYIVSLDVQQSLLLGSPRLLRNLNDISDTKLPSASKIDYVKDIKELIVIKNFTLFYQIDLCIVAVLNHTLNISVAKNVRKLELDALISNLKQLTCGEKGINDVITSLINNGLLSGSEVPIGLQKFDDIYDLPKLDEILQESRGAPGEPQSFENGTDKQGSEMDKKLDLPHEATSRALFFSKHMTLRMLIYLLNYILFTHYEPLGSEDPTTTILAKGYAQQALNFALDGYRNCMIFFSSVSHQKPLFQYMNVVLCFHSLDIGHRALQFIVCLILRVKCGPLTGMRENQTIFGTSTSSSSNSSSVEDEGNDDSNMKKEKEQLKHDDLLEDISLDSSDNLAEKLMSRMILFRQLTESLSQKYTYSIRMMKSTSFFISLLTAPSGSIGKSSGKKHGFGKLMLSNWKHPKISNMSALLSGDTSEINKCPVYQDSLGFISSRPGSASLPSLGSMSNLLTGNITSGERLTPQLPPIRPYQPITYSSSHMRISSRNEGDPKFPQPENYQTKNNLVPSPLSPAGNQSKQNSQQLPPIYPQPPRSPVPISMLNGTPNPQSLPERSSPLNPGATTPVPVFNKMSDLPAFSGLLNNDGLQSDQIPLPPLSMSKNNIAWGSTPESEQGSHLTPNTTTSSSMESPDFEEFIIQNSNFNGLLINPTSLAEAMGSISVRDDSILNLSTFADTNTNSSGNQTPNGGVNNELFPMEMPSTDFLPIDNFAIDGFMDASKMDIGSIWE
ncbi:Heme-responsive zinc finger transcription factor HAP1 [Nakaseomyces bracarensis]|uniref:Heme-responsive zinc finger transcription factor HAP1 n=1 Tax=Nakaseomyces bracarensis TaxID=273131 RepID=A0ABR4P0W9_9SACH